MKKSVDPYRSQVQLLEERIKLLELENRDLKWRFYEYEAKLNDAFFHIQVLTTKLDNIQNNSYPPGWWQGR
jgi:hypothetical protein